MTEVAKALKAFYGSFGIPAYTEDNVPDDVKMPYITYTAPQSDVFSSATHQARVWYYGNSNVAVNAKVDEILAAIGRSGKKLKAGDGYVYIFRGGGTVAQHQPSDDTTRIVYLNLELRCHV